VSRLVARAIPDAAPALTSACLRATGGNPFLLRELLNALRAEGADPAAVLARVDATVPESVARFVLVRLARLGEAAQRVARAAAILGDGAPLARVAALAEIDEREAGHAADTLAEADVLEPGGPIRFRHALLRSAVATELPAFERGRAHRRAAALLAADGEAADVVAMHLLESEPAGDADTVATVRAAATGALARGDPGAAKRLLARALAEPPPAPQRGELLADLARAELLDADPAAAGHFAEAIDELRDPAARALALSELGGVLYVLDDRAGAAEKAEQALSEVPHGEPLGEALLAGYLSVAGFHADLRPRADERALPVMEAARAGRLPGDPGLLAHVAMRLALSGEHPDRVLEVAERSLAADPLIVPGTHGLLFGFVLHSLVCVDQLDAVDRIALTGMAAAQRTGDTVAFAGASYHRAIASYHRGALTDALADIEQALLPRAQGWTAGEGWVGELLIHVHLERGDVPAARDALELAAGAADDSMDRGLVLDARAKLALADYDPATALTLAEQSGAHLMEAFAIDHPGLAAWRNTAARAAHLLGDHERARRLADEGLDRARSCQVPRAIGAALHTAGVVAEHGAAVPLLHEAVAELARSPSKLEHARALVSLGSALRREGRRAECRQPLLEGLERADAMRATPLAERARTELDSIGSRPRRTVLSGIDSLTPTEHRVAGLAAGGASNPEIAQSLFVTVKTIETHLGRAYRKLGIGSRTDLEAALGAQRGRVEDGR
ncbi:MAG: hypothetical protein QOJ07_1798, partial [Thermoleophilaceae bacterium]|nr:hypothetical protein [Thermoleophilaceae bacterium]